MSQSPSRHPLLRSPQVFAGRRAITHSRSRNVLAGLLLAAITVASPAAASAAPLQGTARVDNPLPAGSYAGSGVIAGDFNGDGLDDEAYSAAQTLTIVFGSKTSRNQDVTTVGTGGRKYTAAGVVRGLAPAGDVDGDGYDDLLVTLQGAGQTQVLYGGAGGGGTTTALTNAPRTVISLGGIDYPSASSIGDFNGDGKADLVVQRTTGVLTSLVTGSSIILGGPRLAAIDANTKTDRTSLLTGSRKCSLIYLYYPVCSSTMPYVTPAGDFDGDGLADVIVSTPRIVAYVLYGRKDTFNLPANTPAAGSTRLGRVGADGPSVTTGQAAFETRAGDVNGDGKADLLLPGGADTVLMLGRAGRPADIPATEPVVTLRSKLLVTAVQTAGDQDGDKKDDLVAVTYRQTEGTKGAWSRTLLLTKLPAPGTLIDLDSAGRTEVGGLPTSSGGAIPAFSGPGDLDGDGAPDLLGFGASAGYRVTRGIDRLAPELDPRVPQSFSTSVFYAPTGTEFRVTAYEWALAEFTYKTAAGADAGSELRLLDPGTNTIPWKGTVGGRTLAAGSYTVAITPFDGAGNRGRAVTLPFTITASAGGDQRPTLRFRGIWKDANGQVIAGLRNYIDPQCFNPGYLAGTPAFVANGEYLAWTGPALDETLTCRGAIQVEIQSVPAAYTACKWTVTSTTFNGKVLPDLYTESKLGPGLNTWEQTQTCTK